jgi:hypothetical protein
MVFVERGWGDVDWIGVAQDRGKWRALANAVTNLGFNTMLGGSRVAAEPVAPYSYILHGVSSEHVKACANISTFHAEVQN